MNHDTGPQLTQAAKTAKMLWAAALAAALGFAAVYVTLGPKDNADQQPSAAVKDETPAGEAGASTGDGLAAFVKKAAPVALPAVAFTDATGAPKSLADFKGKTVLLYLWATWCVPCREEMPALDRLQKALGSKDFEVVALSLDRAGADAAKKFLVSIKVENLALYIDQSMRAGSTLRALGMPTTILIDKEGREIGRLAGPAEWDSEAAKALIAAAIKG